MFGENGVSMKSLVAVLACFVLGGKAKSSSVEQRRHSLQAASLYLLLLRIPGKSPELSPGDINLYCTGHLRSFFFVIVFSYRQRCQQSIPSDPVRHVPGCCAEVLAAELWQETQERYAEELTGRRQERETCQAAEEGLRGGLSELMRSSALTSVPGFMWAGLGLAQTVPTAGVL